MAGFGSIQKTGQYSWKLTVSGGFDDSGKRRRFTKTIRASSDNEEQQRKEAQRQLVLFQQEIERGQVVNSGKMTLKDFIAIWLEKHADRQLAPKTALRYKQLLNLWIVPALGHIRLNKLKPPQILDFYANLEEDGIRKDGKLGCLSDRTRLHIHRLLHTILQTAVQWDYLPINPAAKVAAPRAKQANIQVLDEEQTAAFILNLDGAELKWKVLSLIILTAGLRIGEAMGIEWRHVDFAKQTLLIEQASQYIDKVGIITKSPKNTSSERLIALPESMIELLRHYRAHQNTERLQLGDKWTDSDRLFTQWDGKPMYPGSFGKWLKDFCAKNNLPHATPHSLRHLSATILINSGLSLKNISSRLGHSRTSITGDIYTHFLRSTDKTAADKMEDVLKSAITPKAQKKQVD